MSKRSAASPVPLSLIKRRRAHHQPAHNATAQREHKVALEKIVGMTCVTSNGLSVSADTGCFTYPAGCVAVLQLPKKNRQLHILNTSKKPISSLCLSSDGKYLAIGEYGHQPSVQVWNVAGSPNHIAELKAHKFGIECMAFSPSMKYMVSVGYQHDMHIHVWQWRTGHCIATNKITSKVYGLSFSEDGKFFVTVGNRRVRFWTMSSIKDDNHTAPLKGRSAILGDLQNNCFVAVQCGRGSIASFTYVLTRSGVLCKFDQKRNLEQFLNVKASAGRCLSLCESYVICGCGEGVVRLFDPCTLDYLLTMPLPHPLGVNVAVSMDTSQEGKIYPDTVAMALDNNNKRLSVIYNDHSHYIWNISNLRQIGRLHSSLYHSACIWDLCLYPSVSVPEDSLLPSSCLVTCSTDNTVRFWTMTTTNTSPPPPPAQGLSPVRNIYSKELMRVIYASSDLSSLNDISKYPGDASAVADGRRGVRCATFHPRGHHLATGDRTGNIRVYDMQFMDVVFKVEAHISEVLCIEYSPLHDGLQFMCSASRDRLIHIFTVAEKYGHIQTIDDHSSSITALRFTIRSDLQLLSCGADKSIMFRTLQKSPCLEFQRTSHIACKTSIYDMDIDVIGKHMVTVGQDRLIRVYQLASGKQKAVIKASTGDEGSLIKVAMDPSGLYVACSSSDKTVSLFDFYSGECLAKLYGHSEVVTQVKFSRDCKFLYSVSGDGCIFIWRLSIDITQTMHDRLAEMGTPISPEAKLTPIKAHPSSIRRDTYTASKETHSTSGEVEEGVDSSELDAQFRLSVGQLPGWAQRQVQARPSIAQSFSTSALEKAGREEGGAGVGGAGGVAAGGGAGVRVEGCWAERVPKAISGNTITRTASAPDIAIIDLTCDSPEKERNDEEEENVFYPPLTTNIDPCVFKVTTPEKKTPSRRQTSSLQTEEDEDEDEEGDGSGGSERSSPVELKDYLKTTFESLSSDQADSFFAQTNPDPHDLRLSISARFFSQSGNCRLPVWSQNVTACRKSWSSPDLPVPPPLPLPSAVTMSPLVAVESSTLGDDTDQKIGEDSEVVVTERQNREEVVQKSEGGGVSSEGSGEGGVSSEGSGEGGVGGEGSVEEVVSGVECAEVGVRDKEAVTEEADKPVMAAVEMETVIGERTVTKRSPTIQDEINKTRKRLEELGYVSKPTSTMTTASKTESPTPLTLHNNILDRVTQSIASINESFRNITSLHQMAVEGLTRCSEGCEQQEEEMIKQRQDYEEAIIAISTAVTSLKNQTVTMTSRHRRRWKGLVRGRRSEIEGSGSSRESLEMSEKEENGDEMRDGSGRERDGDGGEMRESGAGKQDGDGGVMDKGFEVRGESVGVSEVRDGEEGDGGVGARDGDMEVRGVVDEGGRGEMMTVSECGERGEDHVTSCDKTNSSATRRSEGNGGGGGLMTEKEVLELLDHYSQQLVTLVRERTAPPSS